MGGEWSQADVQEIQMLRTITDSKDTGVFRILMTEEPQQNNSEKQVATGR